MRHGPTPPKRSLRLRRLEDTEMRLGLGKQVAESLRGLPCKRRHLLPAAYSAVELDCGYRLGTVVEVKTVIEVNRVNGLLPAHETQLLAPFRLGAFRNGHLTDFRGAALRGGLQRMVL